MVPPWKSAFTAFVFIVFTLHVSVESLCTLPFCVANQDQEITIDLFNFNNSTLNFSPIVHRQTGVELVTAGKLLVTGGPTVVIVLATPTGAQAIMGFEITGVPVLVSEAPERCPRPNGPVILQNSTLTMRLNHTSQQTLLVNANSEHTYNFGTDVDACSIYMLVGARAPSITSGGDARFDFEFIDTEGQNTTDVRIISDMFSAPIGNCLDKCAAYVTTFSTFDAASGSQYADANLFVLFFDRIQPGIDAIRFITYTHDLIVFGMVATKTVPTPTEAPTRSGPASAPAPPAGTPTNEMPPNEPPPSQIVNTPTEAPTRIGGPTSAPAPPVGTPTNEMPPSEPPRPPTPPTDAPIESAPQQSAPVDPTPARGTSGSPVAAPNGCPQPQPFVPIGASIVCNGSAWIITGSIVINSTTVTQGAGSGIIFTVQSATLNPTVVEGCVSVGADTNATIQIDSSTIATLIANKNLSYTLLQSQQGCLTGSFKSISVQCADAAQCESNCVNSTQQQTSRQLSVLFTAGCPLSGVDNGFIASSLWWIILVAVLGFVIIVALVIVILARTNTKVRQTLFPFMDRRNGPTNVEGD